MKKKVMISQVMRGLSDERIKEAREEIIYKINEKLFPNEEIEIVDNYFEEYPDDTTKNKPVWYIGKSIQKLAEADALVVETHKALEARGCKIEYDVAYAYNIPVYFLDDLDN